VLSHPCRPLCGRHGWGTHFRSDRGVHPRSQNQGPGAPRYVINCSEMDSALMFAIDGWERCYDCDSLLDVMGGWDDSSA
jgi:hypothetical protein